MEFTEDCVKQVIREELEAVLESNDKYLDMFKGKKDYHSMAVLIKGRSATPEEKFVLYGNRLIEMYESEARSQEGISLRLLAMDLRREGILDIEDLALNFENNPFRRDAIFDLKKDPYNDSFVLVSRESSGDLALEAKKKKACKPAKGKRFAKRVNGKCRSFGQSGQAKGGGDRIRPGTKKGDAYCARSAKIKKCKNPPCANDLSRKKWKCRGSKSMK